MPVLSAMQAGIALDLGFVDFQPVPVGGDISFINCALECVRFLGRQAGLDQHYAKHIPTLVRWGMLECVANDLGCIRTITNVEIDMLRVAGNQVAKCAGLQVGSNTTMTAHQLQKIQKIIESLERDLDELDTRKSVLPSFALNDNFDLQNVKNVCQLSWFGRLRLDVDVEHLAGDAPIPPIYRPIEMTLVPETVRTLGEVGLAMRHALNICVLLANQSTIVRNSFTLRVCLIEHLFVRVIPLPLPITHPERNTRCFWHAQYD
jgi:hypothetical protein